MHAVAPCLSKGTHAYTLSALRPLTATALNELTHTCWPERGQQRKLRAPQQNSHPAQAGHLLAGFAGC